MSKENFNVLGTVGFTEMMEIANNLVKFVERAESETFRVDIKVLGNKAPIIRATQTKEEWMQSVGLQKFAQPMMYHANGNMYSQDYIDDHTVEELMQLERKHKANHHTIYD